MKKRKLLGIVGLSIITLGIYALVWLVKIKKELNSKNKIHIPTIWLLFVPQIIMIVSFILLLVIGLSGNSSPSTSTTTTYNFNSASATNYSFNSSTPAASTSTIASLLIFIFLYFISIILWFGIGFYWFLRFSKAVNEYTDGKMGIGETFLLFWVLQFLGILVLQDTFNDMINEGTIPNGPSQPAAPAAPVPPMSDGPAMPSQPIPSPMATQPDPIVISPPQSVAQPADANSPTSLIQ
jgi:hypothetical protein